jgi:glycosyltransferase involved in cell wall biosynthesis
MDMARDLDVLDAFRPLGMVPSADLMGLMHHSIAVINPSKFEGWSTTVEEAKSMGKIIVLSDIPVHREQAPERAAFFDPEDAAQLADTLLGVWDGWDAAEDRIFIDRAATLLPARRQAFARRYEQIVDIARSHRGQTCKNPVAASRATAG